MTDIKYPGLIIPGRCVKDSKSKDFAQDNMSGWVPVELTADEWFQKLEHGAVIQPSRFNKKDGRWTHGSKPWVSTQWIFADGDNFKGVEFETDEDTGELVDKCPNGVEPTQEMKGVFNAFPELADHLFAAQESVNSMVEGRFELPHYRWRLIFFLDEPVTTPEHYKQILETLGKKFPVISPDLRSPGQPVFGNAREGHSTVWTKGNVLKLSDYPYSLPKIKTSDDGSYDGLTLLEWMNKHKIQYTPDAKNPNFYRVPCPFSSGHTGGKDDGRAFLSDDGGKFAYYCPHSHCKTAGNNTFKRYKEGMGIKSKVQQKKDSPPKIDATPDADVKGTPIVYTHEIIGDDVEPKPQHEISDEVFGIMLSQNKAKPDLFYHADGIATVAAGKIKAVTPDSIPGIISRKVRIKSSIRRNTFGNVTIQHKTLMTPPKPVCLDLLTSQPVDQLPEIRKVVPHPVLTRDKDKIRIRTEKGYDETTKLYLSDKADIDFTDMDTEKIKEVFDDFYGDFPYKSDAGLVATIALALTHIVGPILGAGVRPPLFITTAATHGAGKSYNTDVTYTGLLGSEPASINLEGKTNIELGKLLYAEALAGGVYANLDNATSAISEALAVYTTQAMVSDRILGVSKTAQILNSLVLSINGVNIDTSTEIADRAISIELSTDKRASDRPFRHSNLMGYMLENRDTFLSALLSLCKIWIENGCPQSEHKSRLSVWAKTIGGILEGIDGYGEAFLSDYDDFRKSSDKRYMDFCEAMRAVADKVGVDESFRISDVFTILSFENSYYDGSSHIPENGQNLLGNYIDYAGNHETRRKAVATQLLRSENGKVFGKLKLVDEGTKKGIRYFKLTKV